MKKFWSGIGMMALAVGFVALAVFCAIEGQGTIAVCLILLAAVGGIFGFMLTKTAVNELKELLEVEKLSGEKTTRRQITKHIVLTCMVFTLIIGSVVAISGYHAAEGLNVAAENALSGEYDSEALAEVETRVNNASKLVQLFFRYEEEIVAAKQAYLDKVDLRARELIAAIDVLEPVTKIESQQHCSELYAKVRELTLGSGSFEQDVLQKVTNYHELSAYEEELNRVNAQYAHACNECKGNGSFSCSKCTGGSIKCGTCNGSGKHVVTWYSNGDWGEKSYTSSKCGGCKGRGRRDCSSCNGGRNDCRACNSGYIYIYEDQMNN